MKQVSWLPLKLKSLNSELFVFQSNIDDIFSDSLEKFTGYCDVWNDGLTEDDCCNCGAEVW